MSTATLKARWLAGYVAQLLADPPVRSVSAGPEGEPDPAKRQRNAQRLASKDVERTMKTFGAVGLEVGDAGRIAALKACLADWLADYDTGRLNGGNPTGTDYDELEARTRSLLLPVEQQPVNGGLFGTAEEPGKFGGPALASADGDHSRAARARMAEGRP